MSPLRIVLVGLGSILVVVGLFHVSAPIRHASLTAVDLVDYDRDLALDGALVRVGSARGDFLISAVEAQTGQAERIWIPLVATDQAPWPTGAPANIVLATSLPDVLRTFANPSRPRFLERDFVGEVVAASALDGAERRQFAKLDRVVAEDALVLREAARPSPKSGLLPLIAGVSLLILNQLPSDKKKKRSHAPRRAAARPRTAPPVTLPTPAPGEATPPLAPPPTTGQLPPAVVAPTLPPAVALTPPPTAAPSPQAEQRPPGPTPDPMATVWARPAEAEPEAVDFLATGRQQAAGIVVPEPPPPPEAEVRRRLIEYSSVSSADAILERFRFAAARLNVVETGFRSIQKKGRPIDAVWTDVQTLDAYRTPSLSPWHSMLVIELHLHPQPGRAETVRVLSRTQVDLGVFSNLDARIAEKRIQLFVRLFPARSPETKISDSARTFATEGTLPPALASLKDLATRDAQRLR